MPAFERAVELGYRYLETDVHVTADGVVVAFHDDDLAAHVRPTGADLRAAVARGGDGARRRARADPPARRAARRRGRTPASTSTARPTAPSTRSPTCCRRTARSTGCCVGSFSDRRLRAPARAPRPGAVHERRAARASALLRLVRLGTHAGSTPPRCRSASGLLHRSSTSASSRRAHRRGIEVHVWTIDDAAEMDRLLDLGVDGIMTDRPAVLRDVLSAARSVDRALSGAAPTPASRIAAPTADDRRRRRRRRPTRSAGGAERRRRPTPPA